MRDSLVCRPAYEALGRSVRVAVGDANVPIIALTATATDKTVMHIQRHLMSSRATVIKAPMFRSTLNLTVEERASYSMRHVQIVDMLRWSEPPCVVFCNEKATCNELFEVAGKEREWKVAVFHADLKAAEKQAVLNECQEGGIRVLFCTLAFGMGISVTVNTVIHWDVPYDLSTYVQEVGRGGRYGRQAKCVLLHDASWLEKAKGKLQRGPSTTDDAVEDLLDMAEYCSLDTCRHAFILKYFGAVDELISCGNACDNCTKG
jgi:ATP-dependent DNA helicase RecQ